MSSVKSITKRYKNIEMLPVEECLKQALLKKARGFVVEEVVEEYSKLDGDGGLVLSKKKVTTKEVPPDATAIKVLIEFDSFDKDKFSNMTDQELKQEKERLIKLLKEDSSDENKAF